MSRLIANTRPYLELCKVKVALLSAFSSVTAFLLSARQGQPQMFVMMTGIFLLACGASALNQYQERDLDARMERTRKRPVPSGRIEPAYALSFSVILITSGLLGLLLTGRLLAPLLGLSAVIWYNGIYTFLKKKSAFAVIPGALVGTAPVAIGWSAGGGALSDPILLAVSFFFFMWQVPHSWLFILTHGDEYKAAGLPSLTSLFGKDQLSRINFIWISAAAVSCLLLPESGAAHSSIVKALFCCLSAWLVWSGSSLLRGKEKGPGYSLAFRRVNAYLVVVLSLLSIDTLFH
jgi:protoheme IX farnesyltransferase